MRFCSDNFYVLTEFYSILLFILQCPPCKVFTPKLISAYEKHESKFEVIFISFDRDEESFKDYFDTMPWKSLCYSESSKLGPKIARRFGVKGSMTVITLLLVFYIFSVIHG